MKFTDTTDFEELLSEFCGDHMEKWGVGTITAELQNLAADLLSDSGDTEFINSAVESFATRAHNY